MNLGAAIVVFVIIWWCVFFAVLPIGIRSNWEAAEGGEPIVPGTDPGAPSDPQVKKKAWLATRITFVLWLIACGIIISGIFDFRQ